MGDAMAQQEWKVVRRRRSSEGTCNMSASPMARAATQGQDIPTRRVVITSEEDMPADYSSTPGGTIFGTTPGGTKIVYERAFLVCRSFLSILRMLQGMQNMRLKLSLGPSQPFQPCNTSGEHEELTTVPNPSNQPAQHPRGHIRLG